jgi:hypothetical protein
MHPGLTAYSQVVHRAHTSMRRLGEYGAHTSSTCWLFIHLECQALHHAQPKVCVHQVAIRLIYLSAQAIRCQGDDAAKGYMFPLGASSLGVAVPAAHRGGRARQSLAHALLFVLNHARTPLALTQPSILPQVAPHNHSFCYYQIAMLQPHFKDFLEPGRSTSGKFYADDLDT